MLGHEEPRKGRNKRNLRFGIEKQKGPRTIVFAVSGTIPLRSQLEIKKSYLTIAGQTAPGDGICIKDYGLKFSNVNNVIMRYVRIRLGDQNKGDSSGADCITSSKISDVIFDHISAGWGIDAIHDNRGGGNFTLQWSIYGETLHDSIHYEKLPHSKLGSFRETTKNISLHHNLLHSTHARHPSMGGGSSDTPADLIIDFRNNLIYNSGGQTNLGGGRRNVINNYYKNGPDTGLSDLPLRVKAKPDKGPQPTGFTSGNVFTWNRNWTADNYSAIQYVQDGDKYLSTTRAKWELPRELVFGADKPATQSAEEAYRRVLTHAGASKSRDACDQRIIKEVKTSSGKVPDSQDDVGGWPTLKPLPRPTDSDKDGMPDDWETANGLNANDAEDRNKDRNSDGFTNLEEYINSLVRDAAGGPNPRETVRVLHGCKVGKLLHQDDFDSDLSAWQVEQMEGGTTVIKDSAMEIDDAKGCTIWFREKMAAPVLIEYDITMIDQGGPHDRTSDLNRFVMAINPKNPGHLLAGGEKRGGSFKNYHPLRLYYVGYGANKNRTARFRRYPGGGARPVLPEHDLKASHIPNQKRRVQIITAKGEFKYLIDGELVFDIKDQEPLTSGWFGFRTVRNHMKIDRFRIWRVIKEK